jgi:DNA-binding transcriptional LysR family regulator
MAARGNPPRQGIAVRIEALRSFVNLVRSGSYSKTAEELFMSSTTIHGQIRALEQELGVALLTFQSGRLQLTAAGNRLLPFAERTLTERLRLDDDISGMSKRNPTRLRISSLHGPSIHILPPAIRAFRDLRDDVVVSVTTSSIGGSIASLASRQADIAILNELHVDELPPGHAVTTIRDDNLAMIIRNADYRPPDLTLFDEYPVATQAPTSGYRKHLEQWARTTGVSLDVAFEHSSFDGLLSFVLQGGCIGMVSGYLAKMSPLRSEFRVLSLANFDLKRRVVAAHAIRPDPLVAEFLEFVHDFYTQWDNGRGWRDTKIS